MVPQIMVPQIIIPNMVPKNKVNKFKVTKMIMPKIMVPKKFALKRRTFFQDGLRHFYSIRGGHSSKSSRLSLEYLAFSIGYYRDLI